MFCTNQGELANDIGDHPARAFRSADRVRGGPAFAIAPCAKQLRVPHLFPAATDARHARCIRTSGEQRLSNFLLWESAHARLAFVDDLWPDFDARRFSAVLAAERASRAAEARPA